MKCYLTRWLLPFLCSLPLFLSHQVSASDFYYYFSSHTARTPELVLSSVVGEKTPYIAGAYSYQSWSALGCPDHSTSGNPPAWYDCQYREYFYYSGGDVLSSTVKEFRVKRSACTAEQIADPSHACYVHECPARGTLYSGELSGGSVGSGFTDPDGCSVVPVYKPTSCDYPGGAADECLKLEGYQYGESSPEPPKPCYTTTGKYIGQVSANVNCPTSPETKCYNPDRTLAYIVDSAASCPANTSPENKPDITETDSDIDPETGEPTGDKTTEKTESTTTTTETVTNPDGSVTTITTTTTTRSDGSTSTTTTAKTEHPDGTTTETTETEETEVEEASTVSGGESCSFEPTCTGDPLQCYQIKQQWRDSCGKHEHLQNLACDSGNFICEGSPIDCYMVRLRRDAACEAQDAEGAVRAIQDGIASGAIEFDGVDEWGQLSELDQGEFNVAEQFNVSNLWSDTGNAGSCPAPASFSVLGKSYEISFQPLCDLAGYLRPLVILMAMWISGSMLSQTLIGTRYTY